MTIFMRIMSTAESGGIYKLPAKRMTFARPANLPPAQHALWEQTTGQSVEQWKSYFSHCPFDMTMGVVANANEKKFLVSASLLAEPASASACLGHAKSSQGYISLLFDMAGRDGGLIGANAASGQASRVKFIRNMIAGLQNFYEGPAQIDSVSSMSVGAGVYTWASYGATPVRLEDAAGQLKRQWQKLSEHPRAASIAPEIAAWVGEYAQKPTRETYRSIFLQASENPRVAQGLKALMMGEVNFIDTPGYRYEDPKAAVKFATALNEDYRFHPQEPQFQAFIRLRLAAPART